MLRGMKRNTPIVAIVQIGRDPADAGQPLGAVILARNRTWKLGSRAPVLIGWRVTRARRSA